MSVPIPLIEVSHLPSASSYYHSLTKTLGITLLSATPSREGNHLSPPCLNFGYAQPGPSPHSDSATSIDPTEEEGILESEEVVFQVIQSVNPRISHVYLWAPSPKSVKDFYAKSLVLNKSSGVESVFTSEEEEADSEDEEEGEILRSRTTDLDGNMLEAVYSPRRQNAPRRTLLVHETSECTEKEARRVLEWQQDVARSLSQAQSPSPSIEDARSQVSTRSEVERRRERIVPVRRSDSYPVTQAERDRDRERERERERGGAAPGAPMRLVRRDTVTREHYRRDELDRERERERGGGIGKGVIGLGTFIGAAAAAAIAYSLVRDEGPSSNSHPRTPPSMPPRRASYGGDAYTQAGRGVEMERVPARSYVSAREEGPRDRERDRFVQYNIASPQPPPPPPTRIVGIPVHELRRIEESSQGSSSQRSGRERSHTTRERSRSEVGGRYERPPGLVPTRERRERSPGSFVSERRAERAHTISRRSESTVKAGPPPVEYLSRPMPLRQMGPTTIRMRSGGGGGSYVGERERERELERVRAVPRSVVEVRGPLGYAASVAPSDSVSSVGGKRERERLRDRMRDRGSGW
jgi:hypothetical protein